MTGLAARAMTAGAVVALVGAMTAGSALGQVQPVTTYYVAVTADDTPLRCGDKEVLYPVARLNRGTLLRVDGAGNGWLRVVYPAGVVVCIGADTVQIDEGGKSATLMKESRLKAFNITSGYRGSWNSVLDAALPAGTKLVLAETEPVNDGRGNAGYKIVPPDQARAFIQESATTRATQAQIDAYLAALAPKNADSTKVPETLAVKPDPAKTEPAKADPVKPETPVNQPETVAQQPVERPRSQWERLEAAFENVRKQPVESAEYTALIGEFQAAVDKMTDTGPDASLRRRLSQRLEFLKLQADIQAGAQRLSEQNQKLSADEQRLTERMQDVERTRQYTIVGRLSASTIYDGKRLPLMFRIMAVGGQSSRTLAYIKPDEKMKIEDKLGQVVGVLGEARMDPTLKSNVITPLRIDTLEAAGTPGNPASSEPVPVPPASAEVPTNSGGN